MRRVLMGGVFGALPGLLLMLVPLLLHEFDIITSDQSQIGFLGVPLLFFGLLFGMLSAAAAAGCTGAVLAWTGIGLFTGVALGAALTPVVAGSWLLAVPLFILAGGVFGAWRQEHRSPPPTAIPH